MSDEGSYVVQGGDDRQGVRPRSADLRLVRLLHLSAELTVEAGPFVCAPTRAGLTVPFHAWRLTTPETSLH